MKEKNKKIRIAMTLKSAKKQKINIGSEEPKGIFIWIVSCGIVDRIVGHHKKRGFIADVCYQTNHHWIKDLLISLFSKKGSITITRYI